MRRFILIYIICVCAGITCSAQTLDDFLSEARRGDAVAQYNASLCYRHGWGTKPDNRAWLHFLRLSAEGGEPQAMSTLADHLDTLAPDVASYWRGAESPASYDYTYRSYDEGCYYGEIHHGTRDGYGTFVWDDGMSYSGEWVDGERYGVGITRFEDVILYGHHAGNLHGYGAAMVTAEGCHLAGAPDAVCYVGYFEGGVPSGTGTLYDASGRVVYYGAFVSGVPTETYPSTESYSHYRWVREQLANGDVWTGESVDGIREGFGSYRWGDDAVWYGFWQNGVREGEGIFVRKDGAMLAGVWNDGELMGAEDME